MIRITAGVARSRKFRCRSRLSGTSRTSLATGKSSAQLFEDQTFFRVRDAYETRTRTDGRGQAGKGEGAAKEFPGGAFRSRRPRRDQHGEDVSELLDRDRGAGALEGSLGLVRGLLVDLLKDGLRRAVHQVLGLLEAQAGQRPHFLDDLDLLVASGLEDDVELILLLGLLGLAAAGTGRGGHASDRHRGGRLDVERLLKSLHELGQLKEGHLLERVEQVGAAELRHDRFPSFLSPESLSGCRPSPGWPRPLRPGRPERPGRRPRPWRPRRPRPWHGARRRAAPSAWAAR